MPGDAPPQIPPGVPPIEDIERAIATIEESRASHISWAAHFGVWPEDEEKYEACGNRQHHIDCIAGYDHVLSVLRSLLPLEVA